MAEKIALAQTTSSGKWKENLETAWEFARKAAACQSRLLVFPEYFMTYYPLKNNPISGTQKRLKNKLVFLLNQN